MRSIALVALLACLPLAAFAQDKRSRPNSSAGAVPDVSHAQVVVVRGSADHMEQVLQRAGVNFVVVEPAQLAQVALTGQQVLMVNCTGILPAEGEERVRRFVRAGGFLYTTDHTVKNLVEKIFPGYIRFNGKTSNEELFPMKTAGDRGLLKHVADGGTSRWQLAGGGYLFDVVDPHKVEVLMTSDEVGRRYGSSALGVRFRVDDGQVIHVTGHFYTQPGQRPDVASAGRAFEQLSANLVDEKKADQSRIDGLYNVAPRRSVQLQASPTAAAPAVQSAAGAAVQTESNRKVRVLEKKGDYARVRDVEGNEGWVSQDAL